SHKLRWLLLAVALVLAVVVGLAVGYKMIRTNYYVGADNDSVVVMQGLPGSILGYSIHEVNLVGCVTTKGELTLVENGAAMPQGCRVLKVSDLEQTGRDQVERGLPPGTLDKAREQMAVLADRELLPVCKKNASAAQPGVVTTTPAPAPAPAAPSPTEAAPPAVAQPSAPGTNGENPAPPAPPTTTVPAPTTTAQPQIAGENCRVTD
ncbi:MAG: serine/threonine protein phosphatase, partial [Nocardia sp.]|nr:serine/threonine protein phosphatase [Nocardia sp.]